MNPTYFYISVTIEPVIEMKIEINSSRGGIIMQADK